MVLYFTGTGNSRYVAEQVAKILNDEIVSINDIIKVGEVVDFDSEIKPYVIVSPIYGWRIPKFIEDFLIKNTFHGSMRFYVIGTCGDGSGNAYNHLLNVCVENNIKLKGFAEVKMPDNYVMLFDVKTLEEARSEILFEYSNILDIANKIKNDEDFILCGRNNIKNRMLSGVVNTAFNKIFVSSKGFHTNASCVLCGQCEVFCAFNNITVKDKVTWGEKCTHCCGCISQCPKQAIEYKKVTQVRNRYYLPENTNF